MNKREAADSFLHSLYIHIPYCVSKCSYCDFFSRPCGKQPVPDSYIQALCNEIACRLKNVESLSTIYIGGGTPSLLSKTQFTSLFSQIDKAVKVSSDAEITVELNPDDLDKELLFTLEQCGVNRISCGIQSMNEKCLKNTCRRADLQTNQRALELFNRYWKKDLSIDLISALPGDDEKSLKESIDIVCLSRPAHISLYSLIIEENTPLGKRLAAGDLEYDFDSADRQWISGRDYLESLGYRQYEVSNFCLEGKSCRHNLAYWEHKDYAGCGSGACGSLYKKDGSGFRWTNNTDVEKYIKFWLENKNLQVKNASGFEIELIPQTLERISKENSEFEFFMMGLRKLNGISALDYERLFSEKLPRKFIELFEEWKKKGLCHQEGAFFALNREGLLFLNSFLEELL